MKQLGLLLMLLMVVTSCQNDYNKSKSPYHFLPSETHSLIIVNELNDFIKSIENHDVLSGIYSNKLTTTSKVLENLNTSQQVYIAFLNENNLDYLILTKKDSTLFNTDSSENHISETLANISARKIQIDSTIFYCKTLSNVFAVSNSENVLTRLNTKNENKELTKLIETTEHKSLASIIFKSDSPNYSKLLFSQNPNDNGDNFSILDLNYSDKSLKYNGIIKFSDSIKFKIDCFKNTIPQKTNSLKIAPSSTKSLVSIAYDDFSTFNKNLHQLKGVKIDSSTQTFLNFTNEIALIDNAIIMHALDSDLVLETIEEKVNLETFRDIDIFEFDDPAFFQTRLKPFIQFDEAKYFSVYDRFIIFSNSKEILKSILTDALNNNTLERTDAVISLNEGLSDEASLFIFKNSESLSKILGKNVNGYSANVVQFINEDDYAHVNGIIQKFRKRGISNSVTEAFTLRLEADLISAPQTVKNHISKAFDIVAQDANNVLYLITDSGNVLWKKQLQGHILGKIEQIDMYKNGRLQLVFATPNRLYVLDRNGNDVSSFPLKFKNEITQPLSVFDYDKNKNYRLLVTQGKELLMYDAIGKSISGFNYKNNASDIKTQPKHFRIGNKDYIAFAAGENLKILNRQGSVRVNVKEKISFSKNDLFLYQNKFTTTNIFGHLVQFDTKGKRTSKNLNLSDKHYIETTSKTLVSMTENKLNIKSRTIDLDYGDYTAPRIFYINDKIYVTTTDLQAKKVYLFDSQAKSISNFPVFGTSIAELQELDKENGLELITQSDGKTIVVYKLH